MRKGTSPRAYAHAVYEMAVDEWLEDLRDIQQRLQRQGLITALDDPSVPFENKKRQLDGVLGDEADRQVRNFLYTLASNNDINLLREVIEDYERLARQGLLELPLARITSAVPLTEDEKRAIESHLRERFGEDIEAHYQVDPSLIGGLTIRVGDKYIDGSVASRLNSLREWLSKGG